MPAADSTAPQLNDENENEKIDLDTQAANIDIDEVKIKEASGKGVSRTGQDEIEIKLPEIKLPGNAENIDEDETATTKKSETSTDETPAEEKKPIEEGSAEEKKDPGFRRDDSGVYPVEKRSRDDKNKNEQEEEPTDEENPNEKQSEENTSTEPPIIPEEKPETEPSTETPPPSEGQPPATEPSTEPPLAPKPEEETGTEPPPTPPAEGNSGIPTEQENGTPQNTEPPQMPQTTETVDTENPSEPVATPEAPKTEEEPPPYETPPETDEAGQGGAKSGLQQPAGQGADQNEIPKNAEPEQEKNTGGGEPNKLDGDGAGAAAADLSAKKQADGIGAQAKNELTTAGAGLVTAATALPYIGPVIKVIAIVTKALKTVLGKKLAEIFICWLLFTVLASLIIDLILPGIGFIFTPLMIVLMMFVAPTLYYTDVEIPVISNLLGSALPAGFKPTLKNFLSLITESVEKSVSPTKGAGPK